MAPRVQRVLGPGDKRHCPAFSFPPSSISFAGSSLQQRQRLAALIAQRPAAKALHTPPSVFDVPSLLVHQPPENYHHNQQQQQQEHNQEQKAQQLASLQLPHKRKRLRKQAQQQQKSAASLENAMHTERGRRKLSSIDTNVDASAWEERQKGSGTGVDTDAGAYVEEEDEPPLAQTRAFSASFGGEEEQAQTADWEYAHARNDADEPPPLDPPIPPEEDVPLTYDSDDAADDQTGEPMDMDDSPDRDAAATQDAHRATDAAGVSPCAAATAAAPAASPSHIHEDNRASDRERGAPAYGDDAFDSAEYGDDPLLENDEDALGLSSRGRKRARTTNDGNKTTHKRLREEMLRRQSACNADAGTRIENGVRRSARKRMKPLDFWRNERIVYKRQHESFHDMIDIEQWPEHPQEERTRRRGRHGRA